MFCFVSFPLCPTNQASTNKEKKQDQKKTKWKLTKPIHAYKCAGFFFLFFFGSFSNHCHSHYPFFSVVYVNKFRNKKFADKLLKRTRTLCLLACMWKWNDSIQNTVCLCASVFGHIFHRTDTSINTRTHSLSWYFHRNLTCFFFWFTIIPKKRFASTHKWNVQWKFI